MNVYSTGVSRAPTSAPAPGTSWVDLEENENYVARHECSFVQAGNKFYMFGGREQAYVLDIYDYTSNSWTKGANTPNSPNLQLNHFQAVEYQGLIWVIGAFRNNTFPNEAPATNIYVYDPARNKWNTGRGIPAARRRGGAGLVAYEGKFFVVGGNTNGHDGGAVEWTDEYDPILNTWTPLQDAPNARDHFSAVLVGNEIFCIGGRESNKVGPGTYFDDLVAAVDRYTIGASWTTLGGVSLPDPRAAAATAYFDGKILIAGGESWLQGAAFDKVDAFDPVTFSFERVASMNHPRHGTQAIVSGGGFFVAGGSPRKGGGNQKNMEVYGSNTPAGVASTAGVLSGPGAAVTIQATSSADLVIRHTTGNTGAFVNSLSITGPDAALFTLNISGKLPWTSLNAFLIPVGGRRVVTVHCKTHKANANASLRVKYGTTENLYIPLLTNQPSSSRR